jgi:PAS domain S-box-containing protein
MPAKKSDAASRDNAAGLPAAGSEAQCKEALLKTGALHSAILNSPDFPLIATDEQGVIQLFNIGAERMLGYAAADMVNQTTPAHIMDPLDVVARAVVLSRDMSTTITPGFEAMVYKAARGIEDVFELTCICKDGSRLPAIISVTALREPAGKIIGYLLVCTDHSSRKQVAEQLRLIERRKMDAELASAKAVAEKINLANAEFLSGMSHELRTSLNAILGFAQLMASDSPPPTPSQKESIAKILQAGWYLMELIKEILDLAMIESGRMSWSLEPMSLSDVMLECEAAIEPLAQKSGIRVTFPRIDPHCFIKADRTRVKQVLMNLLSNAIKFNQAAGSVVVECSMSAAQRVRVSVTDTGAGLPPEKLDQLFRPFSRVGQQETSAVAGAGIGLVVTKRLVELMGGAIGVRSRVGKGSVFWIELVAAAASQLVVDEPEPAPVVPRQAGDGAVQRTLLYVEDNPANLQLVEQIVARRPDMRLLSARNGTLGIELARSAQPDVILMDINLPGMSGIKAMQILRADTATAHIPVVALSANAIPRDIERGLQAGFFRYLTKPIRVQEFMDTLDVALEFTQKGGQSEPVMPG